MERVSKKQDNYWLIINQFKEGAKNSNLHKKLTSKQIIQRANEYLYQNISKQQISQQRNYILINQRPSYFYFKKFRITFIRIHSYQQRSQLTSKLKGAQHNRNLLVNQTNQKIDRKQKQQLKLIIKGLQFHSIKQTIITRRTRRRYLLEKIQFSQAKDQKGDQENKSLDQQKQFSRKVRNNKDIWLVNRQDMEELLKDKGYFKFIIGRSRVKGQFNREIIQRKYQEKDWVKEKIQIKQIIEVIDEIEDICNCFMVNRIIFALQLFCAMMAFALFVIGIIINVQVTKSDSSVKLYNFWDLSWPYFSCFFFIPLISLGLFFINKHYLNKYERMISQYFAEININIFEKQQIIWKIGEQCSYVDLSQVSKLRSNSQEMSIASPQSIKTSKKADIENKNISIETESNQHNISSSFNPIQINSNVNYQKEYFGGNPETMDNSAL